MKISNILVFMFINICLVIPRSGSPAQSSQGMLWLHKGGTANGGCGSRVRKRKKERKKERKRKKKKKGMRTKKEENSPPHPLLLLITKCTPIMIHPPLGPGPTLELYSKEPQERQKPAPHKNKQALPITTLTTLPHPPPPLLPPILLPFMPPLLLPLLRVV